MAQDFLSGFYGLKKLNIHGKDFCHWAQAQMSQRETYILDFLGPNHLCYKRKGKQGEFLLNKRKAGFMYYDDGNSDSHFPN